MSESNLYIQNSYFETFCLACVEAIQCGCNLLISRNIGALSVLKNVDDDHIIFNSNDIEEIKNKIEKCIKDKNRSNISLKECLWKKQSFCLIDLINRE